MGLPRPREDPPPLPEVGRALLAWMIAGVARRNCRRPPLPPLLPNMARVPALYPMMVDESHGPVAGESGSDSAAEGPAAKVPPIPEEVMGFRHCWLIRMQEDLGSVTHSHAGVSRHTDTPPLLNSNHVDRSGLIRAREPV